MRALQWSPVLTTGIAVVDEQHQRLVELFNQAAAAQANGMDREHAARLLESLFDYTRYHFREEAQLMRRWKVDATHLQVHLQAHERFIALLKQSRQLAEDNPAEFGVYVLAFLAQWLLHHIMGLDANMARKIRASQGEAAPAAEAAPRDDVTRDYLVEIIGQFTAALEQRTFQLLDQRQKLLEAEDLYHALLLAADVLIHSRSETEMMEKLCDTLSRGTRFHTVWIARPGPTQAFSLLAMAGSGATSLRQALLRLGVDTGTSMVARAWEAQKAEFCNDLQADAGLRPGWCGGFSAPGWGSMLVVPVYRGSHRWAVLGFVSGRRGAIDEGTLALCGRTADLLGYGLDELDRKIALKHVQDTESHRARTDALTGLPNRLALEEYLASVLVRAERRGDLVAVGMIDVDDFKPVNDRFGHAAGDALLRALAQALRLRLRRGDFLARLGGDELVVVFEDLDANHHAKQLRIALQRLHGAVEHTFDLGEGRSAQVDMTMGLALYPRDATDCGTLLRLADAAMYANKRQKADRAQWWRMGSGDDVADDRTSEKAVEPFGEDASFLLQALDAHVLDEAVSVFAATFYNELSERAEYARILRCLEAAEFEHLKQMQTQHLRFLLQPGTTREEILSQALRSGITHGLIGLSAAAITESFGLYEDFLRITLERALISSHRRYQTLRVASGRLRLDMHAQLAAIDRVRDTYLALLESPPSRTASWFDAITAVLQSLGELPGIRHAILFRPDEHGMMRDVAGSGEGYVAIAKALAEQGLHPRLQDASSGLSASAWVSRQIQVADAYLLDDRLAHLHGLARMAQWRSVAAIPIGGRGSTDSVLLLFGAYPHQFSSPWARNWMELLRIRLDLWFESSVHARLLPDLSKVRSYRELLYARHAQMWVQPIVDLDSGGAVKVEALARLVDVDGQVITPAQFLPAFGEQELNTLFMQGLEQSLENLHRWRETGLDIGVTLNLPPSTLTHPDCVRRIEQALHRAQVAPKHLTLELLESEDLEGSCYVEPLHAIDAMGVRLALDDLSAGYGSLRRLATLPIDTVKVDKTLILELPNDPVKTIRMLAALIKISQQFACNTVIEGLEHPGHCELGRLLGARLGQGFAIARPMPADAFQGWVRGTSAVPANGTELHTWAGAMAFHWAAMNDERHPWHPGPLASCPLTRFLQAQGIDVARPLRWHDQTHSIDVTGQAKAAAESLLQWIAERVAKVGAT